MTWVTSKDGNIIVNQLSGWTMASAFETSVLVQMRFAGQSEAGEIRERAVQIAFPADVADRFAQELAQEASKILSARPAQPSN